MTQQWQRSSKCEQGACVEVASPDDGHVLVRGSSNPRMVLRFTADEWEAFVAGVRGGDFDYVTKT